MLLQRINSKIGTMTTLTPLKKTYLRTFIILKKLTRLRKTTNSLQDNPRSAQMAITSLQASFMGPSRCVTI